MTGEPIEWDYEKTIAGLRAELAGVTAERDEARETHEICHRDAVAAVERAESSEAALVDARTENAQLRTEMEGQR